MERIGHFLWLLLVFCFLYKFFLGCFLSNLGPVGIDVVLRETTGHCLYFIRHAGLVTFC